MSDKIKVSIIVPIYNVQDYLRRCVESLVNQTLQDIEIILINDGSPDDSQVIIDEFVEKYPHKVIGLVKENGGLSDARNFGIPYAKGEFIGFVDSDDYLDVTMYEKLYNKAVGTDSDIVTCGYYGVDENANVFRYFQKGRMEEFGKSISENPTLLYINSPYAWNKLYRKSLFLKHDVRFPKGLIYEDIATIYPIFSYANKISKVDEALYYYILKREGAITATYSDKILQMYQSLAILNDFYIKEGKFEEFYDVLCFINVKHGILRCEDFLRYRNFKLQHTILNVTFDHLHKYFPDWSKNKIFFNDVFKGKFSRHFIKYKLFWYGYIFIPNTLITTAKKAGNSGKKLILAFGKRAYVNKFIYAKYWKNSPIVKKQVLFESFHGTTMSDSPFYMMKELEKNPEYKIYYVTTKDAYPNSLKMKEKYNLNIELVLLRSLKYQKLLACSEFLVNNVSFPGYFMKRDGQVYINTWHGTPLKTLGKKMLQGIQDMSNMQRNFLEADYLLHPNEYTMDHMMEDYNLTNIYTGKVILEGYPRNSIFLDREKEKEMRKKFGFEGKEIYAYMPTWRGATSSNKSVVAYQKELNHMLRKLDKNLGDHQTFYVNLHPLVKQNFTLDGFEHIQVFPPNVDNYEFLNAVDVLVTDYSSVFFDFSISKKPIVLFMYDYQDYMHERGMYLDVKSLPFHKAYDVDDMIAYIKEEDKHVDYTTQAYRDYEDMFIKYDRIDAAKRINDFVFEGHDHDIKIFDYASNKEIKHSLYLADLIRHRDDYKKIEVVKTMERPIGVFLRNNFTSHTLNILHEKYNKDFDYVVIDTNMNETFFEKLKVVFCRKLKRYRVDALYARELDRILPDIKVEDVVIGHDSFRNNCIQRAVKKYKK